MSKKERIGASVKLISALQQFQSQYHDVPKVPHTEASGSDEDDDQENVTSDGLDDLNVEDVSYAIRRLARGLASPRESSRLGFAVALTEVCSVLSQNSSVLILFQVAYPAGHSDLLPNNFTHH